MRTRTLPLIILAGGDRQPTRLPEGGADKRPLSGLKGVDIRLGDRSIVDLLLERLHAAEAFGPIYLAGPSSVFGEERQGVQVVDTDGTFGENIETSISHVMAEQPDTPLALITVDVLPDVEELKRQLDDFDRHRPLAFWFALVRSPEDPEQLGNSSWKPKYRIASEDGVASEDGAATTVLPGHLIIIEPSCWRLDIAFKTFALAFKTRNRAIGFRLFFIIRHIVLFLLAKDLGRILHFRLPTLSAIVLTHALVIGTKLKRGALTASEMADRFCRIFVKSKDQHRLRGRIVLTDALTLAKDIDTFEEAEEMSRQLGRREEAGR